MFELLEVLHNFFSEIAKTPTAQFSLIVVLASLILVGYALHVVHSAVIKLLSTRGKE
jgi:hypothetical protein